MTRFAVAGSSIGAVGSSLIQRVELGEDGVGRAAIRFTWTLLAIIGALTPRAIARITVTSYQTVAHTNAYAPLSENQYFLTQTLTNVSPATAQVSADWTGTNTGGGPTTWHWVGSARATSTTVFDSNNLMITGAGSFSHELTTTSGFIDPSGPSTYSPGSAANLDTFFELDAVEGYSLIAQLNQRGRVRLSSFEGAVIFDQINPNPAPLFLQLSGSLPPGHYEFLATASIGVPNLSNGLHHLVASGSYENLTFTVQVPEPTGVGGAIAILVANAYRRRRRPRRPK